jgi:hypothetical protein
MSEKDFLKGLEDRLWKAADDLRPNMLMLIKRKLK